MNERRFKRGGGATLFPKPWNGATLLLDGDNLLVRSIYAAKNSQMSSSNGIVTGPLLIFINQVSRYIRLVDPLRVVVCWDGGRSRYRLSIDPDYKKSRNAPSGEEAEIRDSSRALARQFLSLVGVFNKFVPGVEADDLIAAYWRGHTEPIVIVSGDKDFFQLLDDTTWQLLPGKEEPLTETSLVLNMGCVAHQIPMVMALTGDSVDDIKGVPGFGTKTAVKFLTKYDWDLERLLAEDGKLALHGERARMNYKLVDLRSALPGLRVVPPPTFAPETPSGPLWEQLLDFCDQLQLDSITQKLKSGMLFSP